MHSPPYFKPQIISITEKTTDCMTLKKDSAFHGQAKVVGVKFLRSNVFAFRSQSVIAVLVSSCATAHTVLG